MKLAILSALVASTAAFAPSSQKAANAAFSAYQNGYQTAALYSKAVEVEVDHSSYSPDPVSILFSAAIAI